MRKNTSNYFQMSIFQRKVQEFLPIKLKIKKEETESLEKKPNSFNEILPYLKPNKSQFQQSEGYENFCQSLGIFPNSLFDIWFFFRSFRRIGIEKNTLLRSPPRELNIQCINNNYQREQLQILQMLAENEA